MNMYTKFWKYKGKLQTFGRSLFKILCTKQNSALNKPIINKRGTISKYRIVL